MNTLISMVRIRMVIKASRGGHRLFLGRKLLFVSLWKCLFLQSRPQGWSFMPWTLLISSCVYVAHIRICHLGLWCCCLGPVCRKGGSFTVEFSTWWQQICLKPGSVVLFSPWCILCYQKVCVCVCGGGWGEIDLKISKNRSTTSSLLLNPFLQSLGKLERGKEVWVSL